VLVTDGLSKHRLMPYNAHCLHDILFYSFTVSDSSSTDTYFLNVLIVQQFMQCAGNEFQLLITLLLNTIIVYIIIQL